MRFEPTVVVTDFEPYLARCGKVVGASAKFDLLAECEAELHHLLHGTAHAHRSQQYYLDVTNPHADKGTALHAIAKWYGIDPADDRQHRRHDQRRADVPRRRAQHRHGQRAARGRGRRRWRTPGPTRPMAGRRRSTASCCPARPGGASPMPRPRPPRSGAAAGRRRRHPGHQGQGPDRAGAEGRPRHGRQARHRLRRHQRPAAEGHEDAVRAAGHHARRSPASTAACSSTRT